MNALEHYDQLYGGLNLSPDDAARWIFVSGWNAAMQEAMQRVNAMPFGSDTRASFAVYFQQMMHVDPSKIQKAKATNNKWKLMPKKATDEMLKAMDECSTEGYDERLYAGHASSVYSAAWDAFQAQETEQPTPKQCWMCGDMDATHQAKCTVPVCEMKGNK